MIRTKSIATAAKPKAKGKPAGGSKAKAPAVAEAEAEAKKKPVGANKKSKLKAKRPIKQKPAPKPDAAPKPEARQKPGPAPKLGLKDVERVIAMLRNCGGIKSVAAEKLNVSRPTLHSFLNDHPEVQEAAAEIDEEMLDVAEGRVVMAIRAGEMQTVRWYLELKGKERGYVRRVEQTGKGGGPVETRQAPDLSGYSEAELAQLLTIEEARQKREAGASQAK